LLTDNMLVLPVD